ncbi:MAG: T9SS type A sorting domain-containing protein [Emticicia sp.]|uniref:T9SS type A sorting domain-containing protein n=1 Tax=Emticicia sp. TaxID=1930953 RepID=UPI003BA7B6FC
MNDTFIIDALTINGPNGTNSAIMEQYTYDKTRNEFKYLAPKTGTPLFETFYFSNDTLNQVELYGTEKNYTILRSEIINGKKIEKVNKNLKISLGFYYWGLIFYSNFKVIHDNLHFISYTFDSTNKNIVKDKYLERLNLKTGVLDSYLVNEISQSPYPLWDYGYEGLLFALKQEGEILKICPKKFGFAPILGFDLKQKKIIKFDTLSQPFSQSISIANNQFSWIEKSSLYFLDTLKRSIRIVKTFQEKTYNSAIISPQIVDENLFLLVRSFENEFSIHHFDGNKLQKIVVSDSVQYFYDFRVSNKLNDNSYLLYFYYKGIDYNSLAIYHFNSLTKQMRFVTTFVNSDFSSYDTKEVFTAAGKYFFKKGPYQNVVTDFTDAGTKILPQLSKQDSQGIIHVSANGNVLVRERETLSLIKPPYNSSKLLGKFSFGGPQVVYEEKLFFFSDLKLCVYENEKIRIISGAAYISNVYTQRVSNDEVVFWDFWSNIYQVNLKTEKITKIYQGDGRGLYFHKKVNNDYLFTIYNQSDGKNKLLVYDSDKLTTRVVWAYKNVQSINAIGDFTDQFVWSLVESNNIIDYGIYKDGVVKEIENKEISVFDKNQQFEIIYSQTSKEFKIYDLTFGSGITKVPVTDNLLWVENKKKFGKYYAINALGRYSSTNDNFSQSLWVTDGSFASTIKIADGLGYALKYIAVGSKLYFTANNVQTGNELWETDGTSKGTRQIADIWEGTFSSYPENLMKIGKYLYCFATTPKSGKQLWRIKEVQEETAIVLGNEEMIEKPEINVYPNPTTNFLNIKSNTLDLKDAKIELFDLMGKKLQEMSLENENSINLTNLSSGIYSLKIILDAKKYSIKVVKF